MSGFVTCSRHNTRRKANYCEEVPVYDADHNVIDRTYVCKPDSVCSSAKGGGRATPSSPTAHAERAGGAASSEANRSSNAGGGEDKAVIFNASSSRQTQDTNPQRKGGHSTGNGKEEGGGSLPPPETLFSVSFTRSAVPSPASPAEPAREGAEDASGKPNAHDDGSVIDVVSVASDSSEEEGEEGLSTTTAPSPVPTAAPAPTFVTPRPQSRYYDAGGGGGGFHGRGGAGGGGMGGVRKVCWNCGLSGHEKPDCPNTLCRACHDLRTMGQYHHCTNITSPSPFLVPPTSLPFTHPPPPAAAAEGRPQGAAPSPVKQVFGASKKDCGGFDAVRCVRCMAYGHMDCGPTSTKALVDGYMKLKREYIASSAAAAGGEASGKHGASLSPLVIGGVSIEDIVTFQRLSCNFCAASGHSGYDCNMRERQNADRWVERNMATYGLLGPVSTPNQHGAPQQYNNDARHNYHGGGGGYDNFSPNYSPPHGSRFPDSYNSTSSNYDNNMRSDRRRFRDDNPGDYRQRSDHHVGGVWRERERRTEGNNHRSGGSGYSARDGYHTSSSYQNTGNNSYGGNRRSNPHEGGGGGGGGYRGNNNNANNYSNRSGREEAPRERQGRSRRGGRSGYSGFSDDEDLY